MVEIVTAGNPERINEIDQETGKVFAVFVGKAVQKFHSLIFWQAQIFPTEVMSAIEINFLKARPFKSPKELISHPPGAGVRGKIVDESNSQKIPPERSSHTPTPIQERALIRIVRFLVRWSSPRFSGGHPAASAFTFPAW
jgi:hypothetical protein